MIDTGVAALLDELTPRYDDRAGDWERVAAAARRSDRLLTWPWAVRAAVLVGAVAAAAVLVLAWPFGDQHGNMLDRALAAVGDGPVLHVVLRGDWGGTLVDLRTGERRPVYGDDELWYDSEDGLVHSIARLGGVVQDEEVSKPKKATAVLDAVGREYRQALESRTARIAGTDTIDDEPVVWLTIHKELLPDVAHGKDHEWAQQVAVSKRTYKPVALRETRDGEPGPGTLQRVLELQMIARAQSDFTSSRPSLEGTAFRQGREPITLEEAPAVLGRTPLWLGRDYHGLPLARVYRETTSVGHQDRVRLTGAKAAAAIRCSEQDGAAAGDCFRALGLTSPIEVRPDGVFTIEGPMEWRDEPSALVLFYGSAGDDTSTSSGGSSQPTDSSLTVTEATYASQFRPGTGTYVPPEGSVFISTGGRIGALQTDGVQISIDGGSENAILGAARALTPAP